MEVNERLFGWRAGVDRNDHVPSLIHVNDALLRTTCTCGWRSDPYPAGCEQPVTPWVDHWRAVVQED